LLRGQLFADVRAHALGLKLFLKLAVLNQLWRGYKSHHASKKAIQEELKL